MEQMQLLKSAFMKMCSCNHEDKHDRQNFNNEKFAFSVSAKNLPRFDGNNFHRESSNYSIYVMVLLKNDKGEKYEEIGRTEMVKRNPHLNWAKTFVVQFLCKQNQKIKLQLWCFDHKENPSKNIEDLFGETIFRVSSLVSA